MKNTSAELFASVSLITTVILAGLPLAAHAAPEVAAWGDNYSGGTTVPSALSNVVGIAAGALHSLALLRQPTVPTPRLELSRGLSGLELRAHAAPGISCQLLRASRLPGPWLPAQPAQFFRLLRK